MSLTLLADMEDVHAPFTAGASLRCHAGAS
ncbi:MAG: hypothetical protein JWP30_473 [Homoserinimonas sp.]|nr:hypothetical protein [Homoserinimonas sp.]